MPHQQVALAKQARDERKGSETTVITNVPERLKQNNRGDGVIDSSVERLIRKYWRQNDVI